MATRTQAASLAPRVGQSALLPFKMVVDLRAENAPEILEGKLAVVPSAGTIGVNFGPGHTLRLLSGLRGSPCRLRREGRECDIDGKVKVIANTHTDAQRLYKLCVAMVELQPLSSHADDADVDLQGMFAQEVARSARESAGPGEGGGRGAEGI